MFDTSLTYIPSLAAHDRAATIAVGTARISAHGQATTSIVTARSIWRVNSRTVAASMRMVGVYHAA